MTEVNEQQIDSVVRQALELPNDDREAFLEETCGRDTKLRSTVDRMLHAAETDDPILRPGGAMAGPLWAELAGRETGEHEELDKGARIGPYQIGDIIGVGGMATVYRAERVDGQFTHEVALKLVRGVSEETVGRFQQERQILASLNHPNIARLYDGGVTALGTPWLAMELVEGQRLDLYCDDLRLGIAARLDRFNKVALAVEYAHRNLVLHRDIKPSNVLVTPAGEPKLLDFGIAKLLEPAAFPLVAPRTRTAMRPMTPEYASPEQLMGRPLTTASDVYQLGFMLYHLLTGRTPYVLADGSHAELLEAILRSDPLPPSRAAVHEANAQALAAKRALDIRRLAKRLQGDVDNIVLVALRKEPDRRYASAANLVADIERHLSSRPVLARRDSLAYRASRFVGRHVLGTTAALTALAVILTMAAFYTIRLEREHDRAQLEAQRAEEVSTFLINLVELSDPERAQGRQITVREVLDRAATRIEGELEGQPHLQATLQSVVGQMYRELGEFDQAESLLDRSLATRAGLASVDHPDVAEIRLQRAVVYLDQGRYEDANRETETAIDLLRLAPTEEHAVSADALSLLGRGQRLLGEFEAARASLEEAAQIQRRVQSSEDPSLANTVVELGNVEYDAGNFQDADRYYREAIGMLRSGGAGASLDLARAHLRLSYVTAELHDLDETEKQAQASFDIVEKIHGPTHPDLHFSLLMLTHVLESRGEFDRAEQAMRESLRILTETLGAAHPEVGSVLNNLGTLRYRQERFGEAAEFYTQAVELRKNALGPEHPITGMTMSFQGYMLHLAGDPQAESIYRQASEILTAGYETGHRYIANVDHDLGRLLVETGRHVEAQPLLRAALEARLTVFGDDDRRTVASKLYLAACLAGNGALLEAEPLLQEAREWRVGAHGEDSLEVAEVDLWVADWLRRAGRTGEASLLLQQAAEKISAAKDDDHWLLRTAGHLQAQALTDTTRKN